jgi:hypothetical protein
MSREIILSRKHVTVKPVTTEQGTVYVRSLSNAQLRKIAALEQEAKTEADKTLAVLPWLIVYGCCDSQGNPVFSEADIPAIDDLPPDYLATLAAEVSKLVNGTKLEDAKKN